VKACDTVVSGSWPSGTSELHDDDLGETPVLRPRERRSIPQDDMSTLLAECWRRCNGFQLICAVVARSYCLALSPYCLMRLPVPLAVPK
jgi:hypothetical protein